MLTSFLDELSAFSARIGKNPLLVQAAGGNTSLKKEGVLYIKASGAWLKDAEVQDIFASVTLLGVQKALQECREDISNTVIEASHKRPSIETFLHALVPHAVVVHVHSINVIAASVTTRGRQDLIKKLSDFQVFFIPYERPGLPLAFAIKEKIKTMDVSRPLVLVLENHGLLIGANNVAETEQLLFEIEKKIVRPARVLPEFSSSTIVSIPAEMRFSDDRLICALASDPVCVSLAALGPLYPDHVVFLGGVSSICPKHLSLNAFLDTHSPDIPYVILPGVGVLVKTDISESAEEMLKAWANTLLRLSVEDKVHPLSSHEIQQLLQWDAEAFRQQHQRKPL
jgi:rhamnose utilization protein RhaD (predicted bifunctional aldolase and dehydrogenase)